MEKKIVYAGYIIKLKLYLEPAPDLQNNYKQA
jgi:hypothetical protein